MKLNVMLLGLVFQCAAITMTAAGTDDRDYSRNFPVGDFDRIEIEGNYKVFLSHSVKPYLKVEAPSDDMYDALDIRTEDNVLKVSVKKASINLNRVRLYVGVGILNGIQVSGGMKLETDGYIEAGDLDIRVEGAANADLKLKAKNIDIVSNGGSLFGLEGVADRLSVKVAGAGHVNARELVAGEVIFRVEGVGFGSVHATKLLDVKIEGVGKVTFKGNPELKRIVEGLGSVEEY